MSKTIIIPSLSGTALTVDRTDITVDSTTITADMTFTEGANRTFRIIPREFADEVILEWYDENKQVLASTEDCYTTIDNVYMLVPFTKNDFVEGDQYEITIRDKYTNKVLKRDKVYCTMSSDLENFQLVNKDNNGIVYF